MCLCNNANVPRIRNWSSKKGKEIIQWVKVHLFLNTIQAAASLPAPHTSVEPWQPCGICRQRTRWVSLRNVCIRITGQQSREIALADAEVIFLAFITHSEGRGIPCWEQGARKEPPEKGNWFVHGEVKQLVSTIVHRWYLITDWHFKTQVVVNLQMHAYPVLSNEGI